MPVAIVKIPVMGKKQQSRTDTYNLFAQLPQKLGDALEKYIREARPKPTKKALLEKWIEDALTELGYWPPADADDNQE